jgi:hypothetical protein
MSMKACLLIITIGLLGAASHGGAQVKAGDVPIPKIWEAFGPLAQSAYVEGFKQGSAITYGRMTVPDGGTFRLPEWATIDDSTQVAAVISDLYQDPANVNIRLPYLIWIARDKIIGKDVTVQLQDARARGARENRK